MTFHFSNLASIAGNIRARANEAARAITTCGGTHEGPAVPWPFCSQGGMLFATAPMPGRISHGAEHLSQKHKLDVVLSHLDPASAVTHPQRFSLGVHLFWKVLWHHDLHLWKPDGSGPACFVPKAIEDQIYFWVEDGRLACDRGTPFADLRDRDRGVCAAAQALARLLSEPHDRSGAMAA